MTDYTPIPDETFNAGSPILGSTLLAMHRNLSAVAEGAANAPVIEFNALRKPVAGDAHLFGFQGSTNASTNSLDFVQVGGTFFSALSGSVRVILRHSGQNPNYGHVAAVFRNNDMIASWSTNNVEQERSVDVSVTTGDQITVRHRATPNGSSASYLRFAKVATQAAHIMHIASNRGVIF